MKEYYYEKLLNIKTTGIQQGNDSIHYHPYESTPYHVLEELFKQYELSSSDCVVDFGCGKGRVPFYIYHRFQATVVGVEMNQNYYQGAIKNRYRYLDKFSVNPNDINFRNCKAEDYLIQAHENRFYFFNPFSVHIFKKIINNILRSVEQNERQVELILYYGSEDYLYFLEYQTMFELVYEISVPGLYNHDPYERLYVFRLSF